MSHSELKKRLVLLGDVVCSLGMLGLNTVIIVCHEELGLQFPTDRNE